MSIVIVFKARLNSLIFPFRNFISSLLMISKMMMLQFGMDDSVQSQRDLIPFIISVADCFTKAYVPILGALCSCYL